MCEKKIAKLAYQKWEEAGRPLSDGVEFWLAAEKELSITKCSKNCSVGGNRRPCMAARVVSKG